MAVSALLFQAAQDHRFGRAVARARLCTAQLDSTCVSRELEIEGSIRKADPRMELAAASLGLLLHRPVAPAQAAADRFEAAQNADNPAMPAELRADLLLLRSDIAIANADLSRARESIEAARALLGESELTALRLRRIETLANDLTARNASGVEALRQAFDRLFEAAAAGNRALIDVRQAACSAWISRVSDAGTRRHLLLALQAAGRANSSSYTEPSLGSYRMAMSEPPRPPSQSAGYDMNYGSGTFDERMQRYRERLARYEKDQAAVRERDNLRASEASATKQAALDQAKDELSTGIAALSSAPAPFDDSPPPTQSFLPGARSLEQ
ncbi:MAG: hypothetical protein ABUL60_07205 [Myxococcales bacterium]